MVYATVARLRMYLTQVPSTAEMEAKLGTILARATGFVRTYLRHAIGDPAFELADYGLDSTKIVTAYGGYYLSLPPHSIGSVSLVEYQTSTNPTTWATITDEWNEESDGRLYRGGGWGEVYDQPLRYRVTAQWGYGSVPPEIEEITLELAVNIWVSSARGGFAEVINNAGQSYLQAVTGLSKGHQETLDRFAGLYRDTAL